MHGLSPTLRTCTCLAAAGAAQDACQAGLTDLLEAPEHMEHSVSLLLSRQVRRHPVVRPAPPPPRPRHQPPPPAIASCAPQEWLPSWTLAGDEEWPQDWIDMRKGHGLQAFAGVAVMSPQGVVGALTLGCRDEDALASTW